MGKQKVTRHLLMIGAAVALAACQEGTQPLGFLKGAPKGDAVAADAAAADGATAAPAPEATSARLVERDVEAPSVFSVDEEGLWDGRPSLGGVWVAHPTVKDPERVIIRNPANGKFVIGALFRRERDNPGPKLQVSSDAATALGMLAGAPVKLSVVALRREEAPAETAAPLVTDPVIAAPEAIAAQPIDGAKPAKGAKTTGPVSAEGGKPGQGKATSGEIAANAKAAIAAAEAKPATAKPAPAPAAAKPAATKAPAGKMYVQLGIFSVEANAKRASDQMAKAGVAATIRTEQSQGKTFWRVLAGPASGTADRDVLLKKIKGLGYSDAYAVSK
ncbi:MAG: SPOR domain-containing protein [Paenirhodobacter sp.]|uniref:SPOR domain-containing protein n=1 Tax=Paenirhodobacter sp. TaxID=1965326 RepID=UPI003D0D496C